MAAGHSFTWGSVITPLNEVMHHYGIDPHVGIDVMATAGILIVLAVVGGAQFRKSDKVEPSGKLDMATFWEMVIGGIFNFATGILGDRKATRSLFFLIGTLAFFILINNLIGLVPGFNPPTDQFNVTIVLGLIVFVTTHIVGLKEHGPSYIKHFMGPVWWLAWLLFPIEVISHLVRPLSLALRLFGNITGDHKVGAVFFGLMPLLLPLPFLGLGLFVAFVQTFVFLLLSLVYIQMSMEHAH